ncbi:PAS domain S-box protein [Halorubrum halodurans]|uniref:Diguanylate cyclase n=1 Tax=Halorubrum halodurans TaxID=1383851 RepID=A0A256IMZ8_9EURY|nr:PAS domain S-box protein [Halorubrum halodurans]OYR57948.1 diguanylate cyclase [Halorubrum halodurans]
MQSEYRERLYQLFLTSDADTEAAIERALDLGREYLDLPLGFVTEIEEGTQSIAHVVGEHDLIVPGNRCPLDEAYCRRTIEIDSALAVQDASASQAISERARQVFDLGTYIGVTIHVHDEGYGTVCFASERTRGVEFTESEETFVEILARLIGQALERRRFERELRARNHRLERERSRFETIADTTFDLLFRLDANGRFTYVSSASERILGYAPEEMVDEPFSEFCTADSIERAMSAYETVSGGDDIEAVELDVLTADGGTVVLEVNGTPATDDGDVVGVHGVGRDVTARKEAKRELEIKDQAIDEARVGITIADAQRADNPLVYVNQGFERITGYDAATMIGRNCRFLQGERTDAEAVSTLGERIGAAEPGTVELVNYRADGTPFWNEVRVTPVTDDAGGVTHFLGIQTDVTERKRSERLVQVLNRVLRHNLRNDMGVIQGLGELLGSDPDEAAAIGSTIETKAAELLELSETARELEEAANRSATPSRLDPEPLLAEIASRYRREYPDATVDVRIRTDRDVCAGTELRRAVSELLENALKHGGSSDPRVTVTVEADGEWVVLSVEDDGPGIDEMEAAVISKGEERALEHGSGLGLWLVNWIVTRYGGSFQIGSTREGSRATIRLPEIADDQSVDAAAKRPTILFW